MDEPAPTTTAERAFGIDELFFSSTDHKGFILSGNSVFGRVSGYTPEQYVGAPHKLIRHPDTPRVVFRLLWQHLDQGEPIAAYVKNKAIDGAYYWVMALAFPVGDEMLSVRLKPTSPLLGVVEGLYQQLRATEMAVEPEHGRSAAMDASERQLEEALASLGFASYDDFMRRALAAEVSARRSALAGSRQAYTERESAYVDPSVADVLHACRVVGGDLSTVAQNLDQYEHLATELLSATDAFAELAEDVGLFAVNAGLSADRAGRSAAVLRTIADLMRQGARRVEEDVDDLSGFLEATTDHVRRLAFAAAASSLAIEMATGFLVEVGASVLSHGRTAIDTAGLLSSVRANVADAGRLLDGLDDRLRVLGRPLHHLMNHLGELRILRLRAEVDAAGDANAGQFSAIIEHVEEELIESASLVGRLSDLIAGARNDGHRSSAQLLREDVTRLDSLTAALVG